MSTSQRMTTAVSLIALQAVAWALVVPGGAGSVAAGICAGLIGWGMAR